MAEIKRWNILLSAFACSPRLGSEDGVGWHWAVELERLGHRVTVLTRKRFRADIDAWRAQNPGHENLRFLYLDLFPAIDYNGCPSLPKYLYIPLWQLLAVPVAKRLVARDGIDVIHHVTFAGVRLPSFLGGLGVPFIFGPVGGGEETPAPLLGSFPWRARLKERLRSLSNRMIRFDPLMRYTLSHADIIALTTPDSLPVIPTRFHSRVVISSTIGVELPDEPPQVPAETPEVQVLYAGRFTHWKGMHLGLQAFARARRQQPELRLVMVGNGPAAAHWRQLAEDCGIADAVRWIDWLPLEALADLYRRADLLLFPSLHDSGGMVVLEAAAHGLPVLCLDFGGPGEMIGPEAGVKVPIRGLGEEEVIARLANALQSLASDRQKLRALGRSARRWAAGQGWQARVARFYEICGPRLARLDASRKNRRTAVLTGAATGSTRRR